MGLVTESSSLEAHRVPAQAVREPHQAGADVGGESKEKEGERIERARSTPGTEHVTWEG